MRPTLLAVVVCAGLVAVPAPASAADKRDLYMVRGLQKVDGLYIGEFAALRKKGKKVRGAMGAFYSEYFCARGKVKGSRFKGVQDSLLGDPEMPFSYRWVGKGSKQRIKGYKTVSRKRLTKYLDGTNPQVLIRTCAETGVT